MCVYLRDVLLEKRELLVTIAQHYATPFLVINLSPDQLYRVVPHHEPVEATVRSRDHAYSHAPKSWLEATCGSRPMTSVQFVQLNAGVFAKI
jgi:hypothetical protein